MFLRVHTFKFTTTALQTTLQQRSIYPKLVFQIPCTPTLGILHNQLSTLPYIFKPKFIPSKHKWASFTTTISYTRTKDFCLWTKDYLNPKTLSTLSYFPFFLSQSSITQSFPIQITLCSTKYYLYQSGLRVFTLQRP